MNKKFSALIASILMCYMISSAAAAADGDINLALNKTVYYSSNEGTSQQKENTDAKNAVDGNTSTRWCAATISDNTAGYPEWIGVDLGAYCDISKINVQFNTNNDKRKYYYEIYISKDAPLPSDGTDAVKRNFEFDSDNSGFTKLTASTDNALDTVEFSPKSVQKARYVAVKITGCSVYESKKYAAASVKELEVYGTVSTSVSASKTAPTGIALSDSVNTTARLVAVDGTAVSEEQSRTVNLENVTTVYIKVTDPMKNSMPAVKVGDVIYKPIKYYESNTIGGEHYYIYRFSGIDLDGASIEYGGLTDIAVKMLNN